MAITEQELSRIRDEEQNKKTHNLNWLYNMLAFLIAGVVGLGEALVAVYFMGTFSFFIFGSAFIVNFLLFKSDTFDFLKSFGDGEFFKDKKGNDFTGTPKTILIITMALAFFAGASCGFLQLNSILTTFGGLFWGLSATASIVAPPVGLILVAVAVAFISAVANMALLYFNVEKFIRNKEYKDYVNLFKDIFGIEDSKPGKKPREKLTLGWKIYHGLFALLGIICAAGVYVVSLGVFQAQAFTVFNSFWNLSVKSSQILTYFFVHATGQLLNGFFYVRNMLNAVRFFGDVIKNALIGCYNVAAKLFSKEQQPDDSTIKDAKTTSTPWRSLFAFFNAALAFVLLFYCALRNGMAQGQGAMTEPRSIAWFTSLSIPNWLSEKLAFLLMTVGSTSANSFACWDEVKPDKSQMQKVKKFMGFAHNADTLESGAATTETPGGLEVDPDSSSIPTEPTDCPQRPAP